MGEYAVNKRVPSRKPSSADGCKIAFVFEYPTNKEAIANTILQGGTGKVFAELCQIAGINLDDCLLTHTIQLKAHQNTAQHFFHKRNAYKRLCKTQDWRSPYPPTKEGYLKQEYEQDIQRLHKEIEEANPNIIIAMGSLSLWAVTGLDKVGTYRGATLHTSLLSSPYKVLATYSPVAVVKNFKWRPHVASDLIKAKTESLSKKLEHTEREIWIEPTLSDLDTFYNKYISKAKVVRQQIASDTGVDIGVIKQIMIAMIYGADITQYHTYNEDTKQSSDNAIMSILLKYAEDNRDDATDLFDTIKANEMISGLHSEIRLSRNHMKKHWVIEKVKGVEYLLNPFRKRKRLADRYGKDEALNKLLSHMLLGVEASILVFVMEEELKDFVMPHHDGWVSINNWNTKTLEKIVKAKTARMMFDYCGIATGFDIKITKKRIGDIAKGKWTKEVLRAKTIKELIGEE